MSPDSSEIFTPRNLLIWGIVLVVLLTLIQALVGRRHGRGRIRKRKVHEDSTRFNRRVPGSPPDSAPEAPSDPGEEPLVIQMNEPKS